MLLLLVLWLCFGALLILGLRPVLGGWGTPAVVVWPPYVLFGLALAAAASLKAAVAPGVHPTLRSLRPLFVFALGGGLLFAIHPLLARLSDARVFQTRLASSRATYDELVTRLPADSTIGRWRWHAGFRYQVDSGPPLRVAILQPGRGYEGYEVALHDPVGRFDQAGTLPGTPLPFNGRLEACRPVQPPWYRCVLRPPPAS